MFDAKQVGGRRAACVAFFLLATALTVLAEVKAAPSDRRDGAQTFRIAKRGGPILLPVEIGEGRYPFLFDTGCSNTLFDLSLKPLLRGRLWAARPAASTDAGPPTSGSFVRAARGTVRAYASNGDREIEVYSAPPVSLGGRALDSVGMVGCVDFETFRQGTGEVICGALGMDAIKTMIVQIDFDRRELSILPSVPEDAGEPLQLSYDEHGLPSVQVEVGARDGQRFRACELFAIDTGNLSCESGHLKLQIFDSLLKGDALTVVDDARYETIAGAADARVARLSQLRLGPFKHSGLLVSDALHNQISLAYLSRYRVIFDFPHDRMYLSPAKHFDEADFRDLSGMHLTRIGGDVVIQSIDEGGAAGEAGLLKGDVVLEIGAVSAGSLSTLELAQAFGRPSNRSITIRRPGLKLWMKIELDEGSEDRTKVANYAGPGEGAEPPMPALDEKQTFQIAKHGNPIIVPVEIGAEQYRFLFDTGTIVTSFDKSLEPLLLSPAGSRRMDTQFSRDEQDAELFVAPLLHLGGRKLRGVSEVTCLDLQPLQEAVGEHFDGVLGMDALGEFVVQIDFDCGKLSILPFVPEDAGESIKMARCIGQRAFELGWLGEDPGLFLIDTGYVSLDSGTLSPRRFQSLLDSQQATLIADGTAPPSARATQTRKARQADFSLGDFKHRDLLFSEGLYNVLSLGYLSRYFVTIDFQFGRIYLKPGARFAAKDLRDLSGLELAKIGDDVVIQSVAPQSGGDRAGLQAGDVIVEIDETGVDSLALLDVRRKLSMPSTRSITINRGAADQQITLDLREEAAGGKQPIPH